MRRQVCKAFLDSLNMQIGKTITYSQLLYLMTIYMNLFDGKCAKSVDVSRKLNISKASVSNMTKRLQKNDLVYKETYGNLYLTKKGKKCCEIINDKTKKINLFSWQNKISNDDILKLTIFIITNIDGGEILIGAGD